ncbi:MULTISPECIES: hypothetical protein [unclassified Vibrio]|uniref:hypothetical protein n=1 Tax=Vibrio TaxID=662 RepID=UPI001268B866|nr:MULTISPECIES: hypothetical protein [unclassified Vibrio]QFT40026.1 hypothetical protein FIU99_26920 [Vibrio sp. THAF64]QGM37971.1 hypothetical protein GGC04_27125 [Vibrio sp. THAF191d]QGN73449.1 hypothetical protein GGC03_27050 [Vibrio sp. THAF191c]
MITQVVKPTEDQLEPLLEQAIEESGTVQAFIENNLAGVYAVLEKQPLMYRNYGPYWWPLKVALTAAGFDLGIDSEELTRKHFAYDKVEYLLCAAWAYQNHQIEQGYMLANLHTFYTDDEPFEYSIEDHDLEAYAVNKSVKPYKN